MRRKYKNPPINELVIGAYFKEPILGLRAEHVGLFWSMIKAEYPTSAQNIMIGNVDIPVPNEIFPLPRFWFISADEVYLVQLQRNALLLNWRKRDSAYPHYEQLKARFDEVYGKFVSFLEAESLSKEPFIERCELNYINMLGDEPYFRSFRDTENVIPSFRSPTVGPDHPPSDFNSVSVYAMDAQLSLTLNIQSRRNRTTGSDVLYFELRTTGALTRGSKSEADVWLARAHDMIGDAFNNLTNPEIQNRYWQPIED